MYTKAAIEIFSDGRLRCIDIFINIHSQIIAIDNYYRCATNKR